MEGLETRVGLRGIMDSGLSVGEMCRLGKIVGDGRPKEVQEFIVENCRRFRHKMSGSQDSLAEIISTSYLSKLKYLFTLTTTLRNPSVAYNSLLTLLKSTLSYLGPILTIYTPFLLKIVKLFHKVLSSYLEIDPCGESIAMFLLGIIEKNEAYFKKGDQKAKQQKFDPIRLTNEQFNTGVFAKKHLQELLNGVKVSCALFYNQGRNVGFHDFAI